MINFGITLQDAPNELPAEVAIWLLERDERYPEVEFKVEYDNIPENEIEHHEKLRKRFSHLIELRSSGVPVSVRFILPEQSWWVRFIGDLTALERVEIAEMPKEGSYEVLSPKLVGIPLKSDEVPSDEIEFIPVEPHFYTTGLVMTGVELLDITHGQPTERKTAIVKAMSEKDWDKAKQLLRQRH